ncbi:beta family protein [Kribbella sp. WER1]
MQSLAGFRTLVALRAKSGEFTALAALRADSAVQPLLMLDPVPEDKVDRLLNGVEKAVHGLWALGRIAMIDTTRLTSDPSTGTVLERLNHRLQPTPALFMEDETVPFIPVVHTGADPALLSRVGQLSGEIGQGCAVRVDVRRITPAALERFLERLAIDPVRLDIVLDAGYVAGPDQRLVDVMLALLDGLPIWREYRSITVLSGSVPKELEQIHHWEQPRFEEVLWETVRAATSDSLRFGDYGAVHPAPAEPWRSNHINLKYTCPDHWLYLRERLRETDGDNARASTLRLVSSELVSSGSFSGAGYSWGDDRLAEAADGGGRGLGGTSVPVAFATSHHLAYLGGFAAA